MIVEIGHFALVLALAAALAQTIVPAWGARIGDGDLMAVGRSSALTVFACVAIAFAALVYAHLVSDFSVLNVAENSHSAAPAIYKISGVWGNHEGSMLLWALILAIFAAIVALFGRSLPPTLRADALAVQGLISAAFLLFILLTSNPFARIAPAPFEGRDLNPILQDPGLAIHPPLLYLGYVGFSIVYSFAAAALIEGRIDAAWARFVRPFALVAWGFLTIGIAAGSFWAYYTLGWGGFWFWDPVENASLMPWLAGTAFIHSVAVMEKRDALKVWTIFLAILAFSFSLLGTFLVRSGVLTSVHAFASDPRRGVFILAILALFILGSFALFAWRAPLLKQGGLFAPVSREGALVLNNLLLTTACATVFFGTLYPLALEQLTGEKITVGAPFFNMTCGVLLLAAAAVTPVGFGLAWKRGDLLGVIQRLTVAIVAGALAAIVATAWLSGGSILAPVAMGLAIFVIVGTLIEVVMRIGRPGVSAGVALRRAAGLPLSFWGAALAHIGVGMTVLGLAGAGFGAEAIVTLHKGVAQAVGPYRITLDSVGDRVGPNYREAVATMTVRTGDRLVATIEPARRKFAAQPMTTTQAGMVTLNFGQIYVSIADPAPDGAVPARLYWKPLVTLIWLGGCAMALGGALSLADRRLRFGVARRAKAALAAAPAE
ncbi:cytochrome c-type biogenesis protein CcmF [Roseiarcus fermentans]|uniref:Cytochrome c-type biogenesis protein CcmF n=1 Tax=Roseiarcus fermentans TaxID=1473586 RepID=A0A366EFY9_9HYPH|nr:heme lyase CcmF/NrfE family subunit [Roseiarcus fermentans]RBP00936.1 cytochrome c-type biogenesis protein CcmF [Roseiarcus fermentans]